MQKELLDNGNSKDYFVFESVLKGNNLLKQNWKKNMMDGIKIEHEGQEVSARL